MHARFWLEERFSVFAHRGCKPAHMQHCKAMMLEHELPSCCWLRDYSMGCIPMYQISQGQLEMIGHRCRKED